MSDLYFVWSPAAAAGHPADNLSDGTPVVGKGEISRSCKLVGLLDGESLLVGRLFFCMVS